MSFIPGSVQVILPDLAFDEEPLLGPLQQKLQRVMVETDLHLPGMFEMVFVGAVDADLVTAGIVMGAAVTVTVAAGSPENVSELIVGEITTLEAVYEGLTPTTIVRGYDLTHRLQRVRRTRAFLNTSDAEAAEQIALDAGLVTGEIIPTELIHEHLPQYDQTDWEFLKQRAAEIGYEFSMTDGLFSFRPASSIESAEVPVILTLHENLYTFAPRITGGNLTPDVEVRVWDPLTAKVFSAVLPAETGATSEAGELVPVEVAGMFTDPADGADPGVPPSPVVEELGPPPSGTAFVLYDRPVANGVLAEQGAGLTASGLAEHLTSTFAEAEGDANGTGGIQAGAVIDVIGISAQFPEMWVVTRARHVFDLREGGYHTEFAATGRHDRSLLGLASMGRTQAPLPRIPGVVCAVVTNILDELEAGRVKVTLPWLSPDYESDWAPVVQFGAGSLTGAKFLPQVGDEVLVGFEFGDPRRPYVLGGIMNAVSAYELGGAAVSVEDGTVERRGFVAPSGNMLAFYDQMPPGDEDPVPIQSQVLLGNPLVGTEAGTGLAIDIVEGTLMISCTPDDAPGQITIRCGEAGIVNILAGPGGTMNIDGGDELMIRSEASMTIQCAGDVSISGATIMLGE
jgi:hypothetical protein